MAIFQRISSTVMSTIDKAVSNIENHDAVAEAMITDLRKSASHAKSRLGRVSRRLRDQQEQRKALMQTIADWERRARESAISSEADREKALACLKKKHDCERKLEHLDSSIEEYRSLEKKLASNLEKVVHRLDEVNKQRELLQSRQSVSDAMRVMSSVNSATHNDLDNIFDRWEANIDDGQFCTDIVFDSDESIDSLSMDFEKQEFNQALNDELDALLSTNNAEKK